MHFSLSFGSKYGALTKVVDLMKVICGYHHSHRGQRILTEFKEIANHFVFNFMSTDERFKYKQL